MNKKWHIRFLNLAKTVAKYSKDTTKVGCIIADGKVVRSLGFNGLPKNLNDDVPERNQRPKKYAWYEHAERNCLNQFPYVSAKGCIAYVTHFPCSACARALIAKDIGGIVYIENENEDFSERWKEDFEISREMLQEAGLTILSYTEEEIKNEIE